VSIATSREEREQAEARLTAMPTETLERDLVDWTLASLKSASQWRDVQEQLQQLRDLHAEEEAWIALHAEELRRRRDAAKATRFVS
jgi:hypothetical protein